MILVCLFLLSTLLVVKFSVNAKIIGGDDIEPGDYPYFGERANLKDC